MLLLAPFMDLCLSLWIRQKEMLHGGFIFGESAVHWYHFIWTLHWKMKESCSESSTQAALGVWVSAPGASWYPEEAEPGNRIAVIQWGCSVSRRKQSLLSVTASSQTSSGAVPSGQGFHGDKFMFSLSPPFILGSYYSDITSEIPRVLSSIIM